MSTVLQIPEVTMILKHSSVIDTYLGNLHVWDINLGGVLSHDFGFIFLVLQLQRCVGSAIVAMGPEKLLALLPISVNPKDLSCSNAWLIPILKEYIVGSSLGFFMEHIMPLAKFLQKGHEGIRSIYYVVFILVIN